jgi:hypothetical protein
LGSTPANTVTPKKLMRSFALTSARADAPAPFAQRDSDRPGAVPALSGGGALGNRRMHGAPQMLECSLQLSGRAAKGPEHAEHTEMVLLEMGLDWDEISALKDRGVVT